jgi:hypothetical protein
MKKLALFASMVAVVAVSVVGVASATGDPTVVATSEGFACGVFDADGNIFITTNSNSDLYLNGKEVLHCIGESGVKGPIVNYSGFLCGMVFTGLSDSPLNSDKVSRLGQSQLWCYGQAAADASPSGGPAGAIG